MHSALNVHDTKTENHWGSIEAQFLEVVAISSVALWPITAADNMIMNWCSCMDRWLCNMQDQKSLMLRWSSFLGGGSGVFNTIFACQGG